MVAIFTGAGTGFERGSGNVLGAGGLLGSAAQGRGGDNIFLNAANGNLLISRQDEFLSGRGPDVGITRTYNSLGNFSDDNGDNWRQSMDRRIFGFTGTVNTAGSYVMRRGADGAEVKYSWNGSAYVATDGAGSYDTLTYNGNWTWTDGDSRITEVYTSLNGVDWQIVSQTDTSGNSLTFTYTADKLTQVTTADGGYTQLTWSGNNITSLVTYSYGLGLTRTRYSYDGYDRLSTVTVDLTPNDASVGDGNVYTTSYTYHGTSKLVASISQTDGSYVAFTYDGSGRVDSIAQTVASGVTRTTGIAYGAGYTTVTDPMGQAVTLYYDGAGQLTQITSPPAHAGAAAQIVQFGYNGNGDLTSVTDAAGQASTYTYDGNGNVLIATDRLGNTVTRTYNVANQVLTETRSEAPLKISSGTNATSVLQPDGLYRITKTGGTQDTWLGQTQSSTAIGGDFVLQMRPLQNDKALMAGVSLDPNATNSYWDLGFAIYPGFGGILYALENGLPTQIGTYDANDNLWMVRSGSTIRYYKGATLAQAELAGPLRTVTGAAGTFYFDSTFYSMGAQADVSLTEIAVNRYVYDTNNRLKYTVSAEGHVRTSYYDAYGQVYAMEEYANFSYDVSALAPSTPIQEWEITALLDANNHPTNKFVQYGYDARGNLSQRIDYNGTNSTADGYSHHYYNYDQSGQLVSRQTSTQNAEYFAYDGMGRLTSSTDLNGGVTSIYFNDAATQTTVTLAGGLVQTSVYNKAGELLSLTEGGAYTVGGTATYAYDQNGRVRVATDASGVSHYYLYDKTGRKTAEVDEYGNLVEYRYDARNRLVATARFALTVDSAHFAQLADPNSTIDVATIRPQGHFWDIWTWHVYDADGRVLQAIDGDGSTTSYVYDASGRLVQTTGYFNKLTAGQIAAFQAAAPASVVLPAADTRDAVSRIFYDKDGRTIGTLDGLGYLTRVAYDKAGRKVKEVAYAKATDPALRASGTFQQLTNSTNPNPNPANRTTNYVYDGQGQLRYQIDGLGQVIEYGYVSDATWTALGLVRKVTTYAAPIDFSASGLSFAAVKAAIASSGAASNPANRTSWAVYDTAGRVAYAIDAGGAVTGFSYDTSGRVIKRVQYATPRATTSLPSQADMNSWATSNPAATDRVTRYAYDAQGQLRFTVDPEGYVARSDYDAEGRVTQTVRYDTAVSADDSWTIATFFGSLTGTYATSFYSYDAAGRLHDEYDGEGVRTVYTYWATGKLAWELVDYGGPDEARIAHEYDAAGRERYRYDAYGTPEQALTQFVYDGLGNLVAVIDPLNRTTSYTHDSLGRVLTQTDAASGTVSYQYNAFGDVVRATDQRGNSTYNYYDSYGRVIASRDAENYLTETSYTAFGEIATVTRRGAATSDPVSIDTRPTSPAHPADATTSFAYDKLGRVTATTDAEGKTEYRNYDAFGKLVRAENKLGGVVYYRYSRRGQMTHEYVEAPIHDGTGSQVAAAYYRYINYYDARGNLTHQIEGYVEGYALPERRDTAFAYDKANRLISKTGGPVKTGLSGVDAMPTETYAYDKRGNLVQTTDATGNRTLFYYDDLDRKVAQIDATGAVTQYFYDAAGNLKQTRAFDTLVTLPATPGGTVALPGGNARDTYYNYDNLNRLTSSYIDAGRTGYWNGSVFVTQTGPAFTYYEYDAAGNVIKTTDPNGATTFSYYDKLGRKTHEVDRENFLTKWEYDAEGNVLTERRYAIQGSTPTTAAPPVIGETASDRVTLFTYDKLGRRLTETRYGVEAWSIDAGTGALTADNRSATITYTYNALGQVMSKTEANGDITSYEYDNAGRLIYEKRQGYSSHEGAWVSPALYYYYNGLDQLTFTRQVGSSLFHRSTSNTYEDGRLSSTTDASGFTRNYHYDSMGRLVAESYNRKLSNETTVREAIFYVHDAAGRVVTQSFARWDGSAWTHADANGQYYDATRMRYNAHGELTGRGITAGPWATAAYQEYYDYDASGRVLRSNAGDGVVKYFAYDKAGNQTLTLTSEGSVDLTAINYTDLIDAIDGNSDTAHSGIAATLTVYDRRGMVTQTRAPGRNLSTAATTTDIIASRSYNAFGEVLSETNARGYTTSFAYNNMGRLLTKVSPQVSVTSETGAVSTVNPTEHYRYDISGRLIGSVDANGNLTTRLLLAGTGHGSGEALTAKEFHADGGVLQTFYDGYGDARILRNELGKDEQHSYDGMGRVTQIIRRDNPGWGQLTEYLAYDGLGQRIQQWNSFQTSSNKALTDYDTQGRIVSSVAIGGDTTTTSYQWSYTLATSGLGTFGGWTTTTTYHNGKTSIEKADMFGHTVQTTDMGGNVANMTFDRAGRMASRVTGNETTTYGWLNSNLIGTITTGYGNPATAPVNTGETYAITVQTSAYDANGNKITEQSHKEGGTWQWYDDGWWSYQYFEPSYQSLQNASATYDALNRLTSWTEAGTTTAAEASTAHAYDANGNIRRTTASFRHLDTHGAPAGTVTTTDHWYRYDSMNRVVTAKGVQTGSGIVRGSSGVDILYDTAGRRTQVTTTAQRVADFTYWVMIDYEQYPVNASVPYEAEVRETYTYYNTGELSQVRIAETGWYSNNNGTITTTPPPAGAGALKASYWYDQLGRLDRQIDWLVDPVYDPNAIGNALYDRSIDYNAQGQISFEQVFQRDGGITQVTDTYNYYDSDYNAATTGDYALGAVVTSTTNVWRTGVQFSTSTVSNSYGWRDGAVLASTTLTGTTSGTTYYARNGEGVLQEANIYDGRQRKVTYHNDVNGQVLRRNEQDLAAAGDPQEIWYRFNGKQMGYIGNNGTLNTDYQSSVDGRELTQGTGAFRNGASYGGSYADFDQFYEGITSHSQGGAGGTYTVRGGETLEGLAAQLWGDSSLWYKLAEANGMTGGASLTAGQTLHIPSGVTRSHHNATTFTPYDPTETLGDTSPTTPTPQKPKKGNKCGVFGAILLAVVAIAVTAILKVPVTKLFAGIGKAVAGAVGGGAIGAAVGGAVTGIGTAATLGAAGSIASQGVGLATGIQQGGFNWGAVGMAALTSVLTGGGGPSTGSFVKDFVNGAFSGAVGGVLSQGAGVALGLQKKFDWAGVAASALGGGMGFAVGNATGSTALSATADGLTSAAARSLITGTSFGDNVIAVLPGVIGRTVGGMIERAIAGARDGSGSSSAKKMRQATEAAISTESAKLDDLGIPYTIEGEGATARIRVARGTVNEVLGASGVGYNSGYDVQGQMHAASVQTANSTGLAGFVSYAEDGTSYGSFSSIWVGNPDDGAIRIVFRESGDGYVYHGGVDNIAPLALTVAYGESGLASRIVADNVAQRLAGYAPTQFVNSYTPTVWSDYRNAVLGRQHDAYNLWNAGGLGYVAAVPTWLTSAATGASDLASSYYRGRNGWIAPFDKQTTDITGFVVGAGGTMATKLGRVSNAAERGGVLISTEGRAIAGQGDSLLLNQVRESGGTLAVSRGQVNVRSIAEASRAGGNEMAFFRDRATGQLFVRELGPQMGEIPLNSRLIMHTQPGSGWMSVMPSGADRAALSTLGQRSSVIVNSDATFAVRFRPNNAGDGAIRMIGN